MTLQLTHALSSIGLQYDGPTGKDKHVFIAADNKLDVFYRAKKVADGEGDTIVVDYTDLKKVRAAPV